MTVTDMVQSMTQDELDHWALYARKKLFPQRRLELLLAQVSYWIATSMGGAKEVSIEDFLFDPKDQADEDETDEVSPEEEMAFFDFQPRK